MAQFLDGVDTGSFKQFGELRANAIDAEQVGMVGPLQNQFLADAGLLGDELAARGSLTCIKQLLNSLDTCSNQFGCIYVPNTLNVNNLVIHNDF